MLLMKLPASSIDDDSNNRQICHFDWPYILQCRQ